MDEEKKAQIISELIATLLVLLMYWVSMTPEWKLEMYLRMVQDRLRISARRDGLSQNHRMELEKFRREISAWEAERRRNAS